MNVTIIRKFNHVSVHSYAPYRLQSSLFIRVLSAADVVMSCHDELGASLFCVEDCVVAVCGVHHCVCEREVWDSYLVSLWSSGS